jgi:zinc protease
MKQTITEHSGYSLASIDRGLSHTAVAYISVDLHTQQTAKNRSVELLYTDALMSGAGKYDRAAFLDAVNQLGATVSASVSDSILTIFIRSKADVFAKVLSIVDTMLTTPHFDKEELKRIKLTVTNALKESKEESRAIAHEELRNTIYGIHDRRYSYSEDTLIETLKSVTGKDLATLHGHVRSLPWTCSIAGSKHEIEQFNKMVSRLNKGVKKVTGALGIHQQKPPQPTVVLRDIPSRQNIDFSIGSPIPITLHHPDYIPLMFGIAVLAKWGGFAGRLMSTVRELDGLTYMIYARTETFLNEEQGYWRIATFFSPAQTIKGLTSTFHQIKKIHDRGITAEELNRFKQILHTGNVLKNDSTSSLLHELHAYHLQQFTLEEIAEHKNRVNTLTIEEVNAAIKHYLDPKMLTVSGAGPISSIKKELQAFTKAVA